MSCSITLVVNFRPPNNPENYSLEIEAISILHFSDNISITQSIHLCYEKLEDTDKHKEESLIPKLSTAKTTDIFLDIPPCTFVFVYLHVYIYQNFIL